MDERVNLITSAELRKPTAAAGIDSSASSLQGLSGVAL